MCYAIAKELLLCNLPEGKQMSNATWGDPELRTDEPYPLLLLRQLLQEMMTQFAATGACLALFDDSISSMVIRLHLRTRGTISPSTTDAGAKGVINHAPTNGPKGVIDHAPTNGSNARRITSELNPSTGELRQPSQRLERPDLVPVRGDSELFPVGTAYGIGQDLIGQVWERNQASIVRAQDFAPERKTLVQGDITPSSYLVAPIQEPPLVKEVLGRKRQAGVIGVVVLYRTEAEAIFQPKQRDEVLGFAERMALYIQNDYLSRSHERTLNYIRRLQQISTAFPTNVQLADLVEDVYRFTAGVVDVSSMLLTLYDRDTEKIYDIFAISHGKRVEGLPFQSVVPKERPQWWRIAHQEKRRLSVSLGEQEQGTYAEYEELLSGVWGDQRQAKSFLLLPMKMFTRVIGSLSVTSMHADAYSLEEILVLETMVQIITVSIENAKLYDKNRRSLREVKQREESLAAMNSALQTISSVLNLGELLHNFVEFAARLVQTDMSTFFQLSDDGEELIAQALYAPGGQWQDWKTHRDLIEKIRLPFKESILERSVAGPFFYLDHVAIEELAQVSGEGGMILLREYGIKQMLMIPVRYQNELTGILAIHVIGHSRVFDPKDVVVLTAICAQAASAIRNAQLFEKVQENNAELQRMDKLKDDFIMTASHELRTPLTAIKGYSSSLQRHYTDANPQRILRFATKIAGATQQLSDLVVRMTEAAQLGALDENFALQMRPVELFSAAGKVLDMLSENIEKQITLSIVPGLWVNGDPLWLRQVLTNLLDNAVKYSPSEGRIELAATASRLSHLQIPADQVEPERGDVAVVVVRVHDQGDGIPLEEQRKIFEKFVRASRSLTTTVRGSGLGLYICRHYIEAMGGKLWLEHSIAGQGSVFSFYLPRIDAPTETGR